MKDQYDRLFVCSKDCSCHKGARYDQIECRCEWFCGESYNQELESELTSQKERFIIA